MSDAHCFWSFEQIRKSGYVGKLLSEMLSIFVENPNGLMMNEVLEILRRRYRPKLERQSMSSRFAELERMGFIEKIADRINPETRMMVSCWKWTGRKIPFTVRTEWMECSHCEDKGKVMKQIRVRTQEDYSRKDLFN